MLKKKESEINEKKITMIWVLLAFILLTVWAMSQPFHAGPDVEMRYLVADYIYSIMEHFPEEMIRQSEMQPGGFLMPIIPSCPI